MRLIQDAGGVDSKNPLATEFYEQVLQNALARPLKTSKRLRRSSRLCRSLESFFFIGIRKAIGLATGRSDRATYYLKGRGDRIYQFHLCLSVSICGSNPSCLLTFVIYIHLTNICGDRLK
jgi:hypothetical protein